MLLGRGSQCINTGGEKVYPEEVEEAVKSHPSIIDAAVVGLDDDRFGQSVTALVVARPGCEVTESDVIAHVKHSLAGYKAPKRVLVVGNVRPAANGKLDYKRLTADATDRVSQYNLPGLIDGKVRAAAIVETPPAPASQPFAFADVLPGGRYGWASYLAGGLALLMAVGAIGRAVTRRSGGGPPPSA